MNNRRDFWNYSRDEKGAVTIEFVVILPMFLVVLAIAFEFGQIFLAHQQTVDNVREAARYLSRSDLSDADVTRATNIVRTGKLTGGTTPDWLTDAHATIVVTKSLATFGPPD